MYEGGSEKGRMIANMTGNMNNIQISTPRNQMFVVFNTNDNISGKGFYAKILHSMYITQALGKVGYKGEYL